MEKYKEPQIYIVNNEEIAERLSPNYYIATRNPGEKKLLNIKNMKMRSMWICNTVR